MSVPRYKARQGPGKPHDDMSVDYDVLDLADDGKVILASVPEGVIIDVVEALSRAYDTGVEDGAASERIGRAGRFEHAAAGSPMPYSLPAVSGDVRTGTVIMTPVAEGYECRWYKFPASLPPGTHTIPMDQMEYLYGGLYGKDRNLIRPLDADGREVRR